ncbi:hypothetical protein TBR22_A00210 [Luteitalea sp. TBR-22]|nr:hypothetical protein TBR22_A00210 [Luteitalea sp. TBR-22]
MSLCARFLEAQLKGDRRRAVRLLMEQGLDTGLSATDLLLRVITPAQREIGRLWEANAVSVADEHVATAISQLAMSHLYGRALPTDIRREHVLVACVDGEWHDMGARVAADVLEHHGFSVRLLGPSVPVDALLERVASEAPDIVLLSMTMDVHAPALTTAVRALKARFPNLPVLVGGRGCADRNLAEYGLPHLTAPRAAVCAEIERLLDA